MWQTTSSDSVISTSMSTCQLRDIVDWVWHRMVRGGIIVFDDYGFYSCDGITKYVESHMNTSDRLFMHNLNGHAVVIKL